MNSLDWRRNVNEQGDFELPSYLYKMIKNLMKQTLDLGTLLSNDSAKTRAYKEQVKNTFRDQWNSLAEALEFFDLIRPCICHTTGEFCSICGGSRYQMNEALSPTVMREISLVTIKDDAELTHKLQQGLEKALRELSDEVQSSEV